MVDKQAHLLQDKSSLSITEYFEIFLYLLAPVCFIYFFLHGNTQKTLQPVLIICTLTSIRLGINLVKIDISSMLRLSILLFIFMCMYLAVEFNFYTIIPEFDKAEHLLSGIIFAFVGLTIFKHINRNDTSHRFNPLTITLFCLFFSLAIAGCWEIFEFTVDRLLGTHCQRDSLVDTMQDIICGTTGAITTSIYLYNRIKSNEKEFTINELPEDVG